MNKICLSIFIGAIAAASVWADDGALPSRLRGIDAECDCLTPTSAVQAAKWGANVIRVTIPVVDKVLEADTGNVLSLYEKRLAKLRDFLPSAEKENVKVIVSFDFSALASQNETLWSKTEEGDKIRAHLVAFWKAFASEFKDKTAIVGYDLLNKPNDTTPGTVLWNNELLPAIISAVREENKKVWLIVEPPSWGRPYGFIKFPVVNDERVIYGFHLYAPFNYLYQGISSKGTRGLLTYPGKMIALDYDPVEKMWNREELTRYVQPAIDFATTNHVRVAVLSFGVARWAPGREIWTTDILDILEQQGWDWCYCTTIGYNGMNPTFGPNDPEKATDEPGPEITPQFKTILELWKKNKP